MLWPGGEMGAYAIKSLMNKILSRLSHVSDNSHSWKKIAAISLLINILLFGSFFLLLTPAFDTNDDVTMMLISSGVRSGEPNEHLIFINVIIGFFLKFLYGQLPGVNWYPVCLYMMHFVAMFVILYSALRIKFSYSTVFQYLFVFLFFESSLLIKLQYTSTAFVVALGGLGLLLVSLSMSGKKPWVYLGAAAFVLVLGGLIRKEVIYFILLLAVPFLLLKFWEIKNIKIPVFVSLALILFAVLLSYNNHYYFKDPQWNEYYKYNNIRFQLHGFPKLAYNEKTKDIFDHIGWSKNDFLMFNNWFFFDQKVFSREKLKFINKNLNNQRSFSETRDVLLERVYSNQLLIIVTVVYLFFSIVCIDKKRRKDIYSIIISAALICAGLSYAAHLPDRVFLPVLIFIATMVFLLTISGHSSFDNKLSQNRLMIIILMSLIIACLLPVHFLALNDWSRNNQTDQSDFKKMLKTLPEGKDKLLVIWGVALKAKRTSPFSDLSEYNKLSMLYSGWSADSPFNKQLLKHFGINDVFTSLYSKDNTFLVMKDKPQFQKMLGTYFLEHYRQKIKFEIVETYDDIGIYKVLKEE